MRGARERQETILQLWRTHTWLYAVLGFLGGLVAFPFLQQLTSNLADLLTNLVPEAIGIVVTVLVIDRLYAHREAQRRREELQARLIREAGSSANEIAKHAVNQLKQADWLRGAEGLLQNADLGSANLQGANLKQANCRGADMGRANLASATLFQSDCRDANLWDANLSHANLGDADLRRVKALGADFRQADLRGCDLREANCRFADFRGADLRGANLVGAIFTPHAVMREDTLHWESPFDEQTRLPDGTGWTAEHDLSVFGVILDELKES